MASPDIWPSGFYVVGLHGGSVGLCCDRCDQIEEVDCWDLHRVTDWAASHACDAESLE